MKSQYTKMSKSRGNVISPDEVVYDGYWLDNGYEFRDLSGEVANWRKIDIWRRPGQSYRTTRKFGNHSVFLHEKDNPVPALLNDDLQHADELEFWAGLLEKHESIHMGPRTP
jgi:valyl-tRNA synthetase